MPDQRVSELPAATSVADSDLVHIVVADDGTTTGIGDGTGFSNYSMTGAAFKAYPWTWTGQHIFTAPPVGTGVSQGSVYINPASANANEVLFGVALAGASRFTVDEDGDVSIPGRFDIKAGNLQLTSGGNYAIWYNAGFISGSYFGHISNGSPGRHRVMMGTGAWTQVGLVAHLDQDDVLIKRDVDGDAGTYNVAGAALAIQLDVTNALADTTNFLEMQNAAGTPLAKFDKDGDLFCKQVAAGDGGVTNYLGVGTDGTLTLYGTARKTKHVVISNADLGKGATGASEAIVGKYTVWEFGLNDDAVMDLEVPPDWASGTDILVSIHWQINEAYAAANGEVQWEVTWAATPHDETEALDGPTHTGTLDGGDQDIPAVARHLTYTDIGTISGASLSAEDAIGLTLKRVALDGGTDPTAEPGVVHLELAYTVDSFGE